MKLKKHITFKEFCNIFHSLTGLNISFVDANADFIRKAKHSEIFCELHTAVSRQPKEGDTLLGRNEKNIQKLRPEVCNVRIGQGRKNRQFQ